MSPERDLWLDPAQARLGGRDLAAAGRSITAQRNGSGTAIAAASTARPWGTDDIGSAFEKVYRAAETIVLKGWRGTGNHVEGLGTQVTRAVDTHVRNDAATSQRVGDIRT